MKLLKMAATVLLALFSLQAMHAQTVDEIIAKHLEAMGGKEKMLSLKTIKMTGSLSVQGFDVGVTTTIASGVGSRTDISVPGMGEGFQIMNTSKGWNFLPFQGQSSPEEVPAEQVKASQNSLDLSGPLLDYKQKGNKVELMGKESLDGADAYKLQITNKEGKVSTYFLDAKTYYRVKTIAKAMTPEGEQEVETSYTDFKKNADGFVFPYSLTNSRGTIVFSDIMTNQPVDEKIFTAQ